MLSTESTQILLERGCGSLDAIRSPSKQELKRYDAVYSGRIITNLHSDIDISHDLWMVKKTSFRAVQEHVSQLACHNHIAAGILLSLDSLARTWQHHAGPLSVSVPKTEGTVSHCLLHRRTVIRTYLHYVRNTRPLLGCVLVCNNEGDYLHCSLIMS